MPCLGHPLPLLYLFADIARSILSAVSNLPAHIQIIAALPVGGSHRSNHTEQHPKK